MFPLIVTFGSFWHAVDARQTHYFRLHLFFRSVSTQTMRIYCTFRLHSTFLCSHLRKKSICRLMYTKPKYSNPFVNSTVEVCEFMCKNVTHMHICTYNESWMFNVFQSTKFLIKIKFFIFQAISQVYSHNWRSTVESRMRKVRCWVRIILLTF